MGGYGHHEENSMRRIFIPGALNDTIEITGPDAHHLMHAMRAKAGQELIVVDGSSHVGRVELIAFSSEAVTAKLVERLPNDTESHLDIVLAQCLPKGDKMELIAQKAVELGITAIQPLKSRNSVVRYDEKKSADRHERWQKIVNEAAKQCGRTEIPKVFPITGIKTWLESLELNENRMLVFCYENEANQGFKDCLKNSRAKQVLLLIGPEGGFSLEEAEMLIAKGAKSISLGPRILRAETAAIAAMSIIQYELGDI